MYRLLATAAAAAASPGFSTAQDWQAISGAGTCAATSGTVAACAAANADADTCAAAGACTFTPGQWDADVQRGTPQFCGVGDITALTTLPCGCSCGDPPDAAGCVEDSDGMFERVGFTCPQIAGTATDACQAADASASDADKATCAAANQDKATCIAAAAPTAGACIFLTGTPDYLHCNQLVRDITAEEAHDMWLAGTIDLIIDVRSPTEYESAGDPNVHNQCGHGYSDEWEGCEIGHIPGSVLVPLNPWDPTYLLACSTDATKPVLDMVVATTCYNHALHPDSAWRSNTGAALLEQVGFKCVYNIVDGTKGWKDKGYNVTVNEAWPATPGACSSAPYYQAGLIQAQAAAATEEAAAAAAATTPAPAPALAAESGAARAAVSIALAATLSLVHV